MAKKPKKNADEGEAASAAPDAKPAKSRKKLVLIGAVLALCLAGGSGYFMFGRKPHADEAAAPAKKPVAFLDIREMTVNLSPDPGDARQRFLKLRVALEARDPKVVTEIQPLLPRVEDTFQVFVRELRAGDLEGSAGVYRLREELLRRVNIAVYPAKVDAVLFKDLVIQ